MVHRSQTTARALSRLLALCGLVSIASAGCESDGRSRNPYNVAEVGYSAMSVAAAADGTLFVGTSDIVNQGKLVRIAQDLVTVEREYPAFSLDVAADFLYFAQASGHWERALGRVPVAGGEVEWFPMHGGAHDLIHDDQYMYWREQTPFRIHRLSLRGGTPDVIHETTRLWANLQVDETHLYWLTRGGIARVPKTGGDEQEVLSPEVAMQYLDDIPTSMVLGGRYVLAAQGVGGPGLGAVLRIAKDGSEVTVLAADQPSAYVALADARDVYWVRGHTNDAIEYPGFQTLVRKPLEGGPEEIVADRQNGITHVLRTSDGIYWTTRNERYLNFRSEPAIRAFSAGTSR